jgi:hypothetical protein
LLRKLTLREKGDTYVTKAIYILTAVLCIEAVVAVVTLAHEHPAVLPCAMLGFATGSMIVGLYLTRARERQLDNARADWLAASLARAGRAEPGNGRDGSDHRTELVDHIFALETQLLEALEIDELSRTDGVCSDRVNAWKASSATLLKGRLEAQSENDDTNTREDEV